MSAEAAIVIRRYEASDRPEVLKLAPRLVVGVAPWRDAAAVLAAVQQWVEESLASAHEQGHAVLIAEHAGRLVGFATLSTAPHFTGEVDAYMGELVTASDFEGRGVGRELVTAAERWGVEQGLRRMTIDTGARNTRARSFYERLGYEYEDVRLTRPLRAQPQR